MKTLHEKPKVVRDQKSFLEQLKKANAFFNDSTLPAVANVVANPDNNPYADKDGLVEFIVADELVDDHNVMAELLVQKKYLIAITSIVTDYVNRYVEARGQEYKTDPRVWELALSNIPLMGPSAIEEQTYTRRIRGISIAKDFIEFIMDVVAEQGTNALNSFNSFLEKQGEAIEFGISSNTDSYSTMSLGVTTEVFSVGREIIFTPKIKQYKVNFDRENSQFTSACASTKYVNINFDYQYAVNVFDYEALEDPEIKKQFDEFIFNSRKAQIENATTFFDDNFPVLD